MEARGAGGRRETQTTTGKQEHSSQSAAQSPTEPPAAAANQRPAAPRPRPLRMDGGSAVGNDSLPDHYRLHPDPRSQEGDPQSGPCQSPTGKPEPAKRPAGRSVKADPEPGQNNPNEPEQTGLNAVSALQEPPEEPASKPHPIQLKEPGGSAGPSQRSPQVHQNLKGLTGQEKPATGSAGLLPAEPEKSEDLQILQAPPPHLDLQAPPPHLDLQAPPPHLDLQAPPPHRDLQAPPSHLDLDLQAPPPHRDLQAPPPHLDLQVPPPHLDLQAPPPHLDLQAPPLYLDLDLKAPPPQLDLQVPPPHLDLDLEAPPPQLDLQVPLPHLDLDLEAPPPQLELQAPPPHLDLNLEAPPPPVDLQNNLSRSVNLAPPLTTEAFCEQVGSHPTGSSPGEPKLCGYLQKQAGPLKAWKLRWFTYEEKENQLFYYRTPQDVAPLGRVELSGATFSYPMQADGGTFHIKTPERTFILKAVSPELRLYWLQQLQLKRWQHRLPSTWSEQPSSSMTEDFLPMLKSPLGLVGEEAASASGQHTSLASMSIKHPLIHIQNSVHSLRNRTSQVSSQSQFYLEVLPSEPADCSAPTERPAEAPPPSDPPGDPVGWGSAPDRGERPSRSERRSRRAEPVGRRETLSSSCDRRTRPQQEKQMLMEEVKAQKELVWILYRALEAAQLEKRTCAEFVAARDEQRRLELLRHRERQAADLRARLEEAGAEAETLRRSLADRDAQVAELQENVRLLTEKNAAKQQVILKLADQVTSCLSDPRCSDPAGSVQKQLRQQIDNLRDDMEAYKTQNRFLNSEIFQLTRLWRRSSEQGRILMVKCAYLEAANCQAESRYLGVLRKLQEAKALAPEQQEAVTRLIGDALRGTPKGVVEVSADREYDAYGFKVVPDYEVEDMKLLAKIQALEIRTHNLLQQERTERPLRSRWAQYLAGRPQDALSPSPELKVLLRGGVPREYRQRVWRWLVRTRTRTLQELRPQRYQQLCEKSRTSPHPASRQIQLDLHRTLTTNQNFSSPSSPALQQLRRILLAFSWQNPAVGYCQGLNRLAAMALLVLQDEEDAFWCLVAVVEAIMPPDYYTHNLVASQADQRVLKDFMAEKLPRLAAHFEAHGVDVSLVTFNWFLVAFVESLPSDILLPVWDAFLYEGSKVIFRYTLALFKCKEDELLKIQDSVEIYHYLRFFTKTVSDGRKLAAIAFGDMNPFPSRLLRNRRALHLERLQGELQELEEQQREFVTENTERKDKELAASEDDDEL